ncbi:hypothetical protein ABT354_20280 [Streptomyces sp. NPDC000594]|uniref:hypothetical protein n=1 Tax=Streptomyces sp. NPDC000594 TaxID=3154261 RepID=UPI00332F80E4
MFAKLHQALTRLRNPDRTPSPPPAAPLPAPAPDAPATPAAPVVIDAASLTRIERIRAALEAVGPHLEPVPAPQWLATVAAGRTVPADDGRLKEISTHLWGAPAAAALTDHDCAKLLDQIEALGVLKEMRAAGIEILCTRGATFKTAADLRAAYEHALELTARAERAHGNAAA